MKNGIRVENDPSRIMDDSEIDCKKMMTTGIGIDDSSVSVIIAFCNP